MIKRFILATFLLLLTGCSSKEIEMINFSDVYGSFSISAPSNFVYYNNGDDGIFLIGSEDGNESIMVLSIPKTDEDYYTLEELSFEYEERLSSGEATFAKIRNEAIIRNFFIEEATAYHAKSFNATLDNTDFLLNIAYIEFLEEYYIIHMTSVVKKNSLNHHIDTLNSFNRKRALAAHQTGSLFDSDEFSFLYGDRWLAVEEQGFKILRSFDNKAMVAPASMEEDLNIESAHEYMDIAKDILQEIYDEYNFEIIYTEFKEVDGQDAGVIVYEYTMNSDFMVARQMFLLRNNMVYVLSYTTNSDLYENYLEEVIKMENSFRILE